MGYITVIGIQLINLAAAFFMAYLAVGGDGQAGGIHWVQIFSGTGILAGTVAALVLCRVGKVSTGVKASLLTLPALFFLALLVIAGLVVSIPFFAAVALLFVGWSAVVIKATRRLNGISPTTIGDVILNSKFNAIEWGLLLVVAWLAVCVWYQLLKLTT